MRYYVQITDEQSFFNVEDDKEQPEADNVYETYRKPKTGEFWSIQLNDFVLDEKAKQSVELSINHKAEAHLQKRFEALLIKAGLDVPEGLINREAVERDMSPLALADLVIEKSQEFHEKETHRQKLSLKAE